VRLPSSSVRWNCIVPSDLILLVGSRHSHNTARLKDVAVKHGVPAYLIDNAAEMQRQWLDGGDGWSLCPRDSCQ
jgi:4-hydroxy-3-methylbut-2-enyl diphosphate reductase IspH